MAFIAPIVEGHGEIEAVPILLRRMTGYLGLADAVRVNPPIRVKSGSFLNDPLHFGKYVSLAAAKAAQERGIVLILLDCEDDCPARLGPSLLMKASAVRGDVRYLVALAHREFESWFIAAAASLRGHFGLPDDLVPPPAVEGIRDAKGWLGKRMRDGYDPIEHQHAFAKIFDLDQACSVPSFRRLCRRLREMAG